MPLVLLCLVHVTNVFVPSAMFRYTPTSSPSLSSWVKQYLECCYVLCGKELIWNLHSSSSRTLFGPPYLLNFDIWYSVTSMTNGAYCCQIFLFFPQPKKFHNPTFAAFFRDEWFLERGELHVMANSCISMRSVLSSFRFSSSTFSIFL